MSRDPLIALGVLVLLADVVWAEARAIRAQHRCDRLTIQRAAHRRSIRPAGQPRAAGVLELPEITAPCNRDLHAWIFATDGAPTIVQGRARFTCEADTVTPVASLSRRLAA